MKMLLDILTGLLLAVIFGFMFLAMVALLYEAWHPLSPEEREQRDLEWELRDDLPENVKVEMRAKYNLLTPDEQEAAFHAYYLTNQ
jgi:uncharacterized protein involved in cysteine biosynthesis